MRSIPLVCKNLEEFQRRCTRDSDPCSCLLPHTPSSPSLGAAPPFLLLDMLNLPGKGGASGSVFHRN